MGMAGLDNAPPSVVVTPKVETAAAPTASTTNKIDSQKMVGKKDNKDENLCRFLEYLLKLLQKKDANNFFASPVNDQFAPGYSQIIKTPMDFCTMRTKVSDWCSGSR